MSLDLKAENELLRERIRVLEEVLSNDEEILPIEWGLSPTEQRIFKFMIRRPLATKDALMTTLYNGSKDEPDVKILDIFICKIRKKLAPFGVNIMTQRGQGFCLDEVTREQFKRRNA